MNVTIVLPSLNPDEKLNMVVDNLLSEGFNDIVIINDGSDKEHLAPFKEAAAHPQVTLLTHEVNCGKGRALKTAFSYIIENRPDIAGVVTVDGDNQHTGKDIKACALKLLEKKDHVILGCRDFDDPEVPPKSRFGNRCTRLVFRLFCGIKVSDTQTGLRAIPYSILPLMCQVPGERYEYETEMFFALKKEHIPITETKIQTVYIEDNASSHFHPIRDSLRIYGIILKFLLSSAASFLIDYGLFTVLLFLLGEHVSRTMRLFSATFASRAVSSLFNFAMNKKAVFRSDAPLKSSLLKYYTLCVCQAALSYALVFLLSTLLQAHSGLEALLKLVVDVVLFLISFQIQQRWVFK
ncbi:MAG: bifunctional glycosyltransferase family 2/GtrA family protein [Lachnospiraceae bacterium]|nr:bifunctional glycosyltransferase family 2/GtrA family protein [Lachnospiraceae bacterium]